MIEEGNWGPWFVEITLRSDGRYSVLIRCLRDKTNPKRKVYFDPAEQDDEGQIPWVYNTLREAKRQGKKELKRWKEKERLVIAAETQEPMRIF